MSTGRPLVQEDHCTLKPLPWRHSTRSVSASISGGQRKESQRHSYITASVHRMKEISVIEDTLQSPREKGLSVRNEFHTPLTSPSSEEDDVVGKKQQDGVMVRNDTNYNMKDTKDPVCDDERKYDKNNRNNQILIAGRFWIGNARLLCLMMALDLMTMSVQIPSLPAVFKIHGMDLRWQGWVGSVYCVISFFVAPMLGRVSDSVGRVTMLQLSCVGSMLGALGSLYATGKWTFIAARTLPGLMKCSLPISQAYIVDVSQGTTQRSRNLGMLGASFGMAFVLGPPLGGAAADYHPRLPFAVSFWECVLLYAALQFLPEPSSKSTSKSSKVDEMRDEASGNASAVAVGSDSHVDGIKDDSSVGVVVSGGIPASASSVNMKRNRSNLLIAAENGGDSKRPTRGDGEPGALSGIGTAATAAAAVGGGGVARGKGATKVTSGGRLDIFRGPGGREMGWGFHDRFFLVVAEGLYHTSFAPFVTEVLDFPTGRIGMLLSFMGMVSAFTNAFLVGSLTQKFGERRLMASSLLVLAVGWTMWSTVSRSIPSILAALTMAGVGGNVFQTVNKASVAQHAPPELVGTVMGMSGALETFGRSVAGPLSGYLFNACGARGIPLSCACMAAYVALVLSFRGLRAATAGGDGVAEGKGDGRGTTFKKK